MSIVVQKRPSERTWSQNPCNYELYSAAAAADAAIYFEVAIMFRHVGGSYAELVRLPHYPTAGIAQIDVAAILDSILKYDVPDMPTDKTDPFIADLQTGYFYLSFREITDSPAGSFDVSEIGYERLVIKGGIAYEAWRGNGFWNNYADVLSPTTFPFFTWQKTGRNAQLAERMYLAWLNYTNVAATNLALRVVIEYTDGTFSAAIDKVLTGIVKHKIIYLPVGAEQLGLEAIDDTKTIYKWTARVFDINTSTAVSELFTYAADNRKDYNDACLNYRNSLGCIDSVMVRGVIENSIEYDNERVGVITGYNYYNGKLVAAREKTVFNLERFIYKGDIGYLGKEEQDRLRDAHLKREIWWEVGSKWLPVINLTGNFKHRSSTDNLFSMPFEWMLGVPGNTCYTPKNVNLGDAEVISNVCNATISDIEITKDLDDTLADITVGATVTGADQFTYQVIGFHTSPITANVTDLPITITGLNKLQNFSLELRPICGDGSFGRTYITPFTTAEGSYNCALYNRSGDYEVLDVYIDDVVVYSTNLNAGEYDFFNIVATGLHDVKLSWGNATHTTATLKEGTAPFPTIGTVVGVDATWIGIDVTDGFIIELY